MNPAAESSTPAAPTVRVRGLRHFYGRDDLRKQVLFDNDLELSPGEIVAITGPSGSGKTTLLTLLGALRSVQHGEITVLGRNLHGLDQRELVAARARVGFIFQAHNLFDSLTAAENVHLAYDLLRDDPAERDRLTRALLARLGLGDRLHHKPDALSGGQKQRVAIARALINQPRLVLADEPTAALDQTSAHEVVKLLQSHAAEHGATVVIVTHDKRILDAAGRIIHLVDGRIVADVRVAESMRIAEALQRCPLFAREPAAILAELGAQMRPERFAADEVIFREGDVGDRFYVIDSGRVEVLRTPTAPRSIVLGPGEFFGEVALISGEPRNATIIAREPVHALSLSKEAFADALGHHRSLADQLRAAYARRR